MSATGNKAFELAFILANSGLLAVLGRHRPGRHRHRRRRVTIAVRADGGDVIVSVGGYNGTKLGQVCGSPAVTAAAYQQVITTYGLHAFDFDLEEPEIENRPRWPTRSVPRRSCRQRSRA